MAYVERWNTSWSPLGQAVTYSVKIKEKDYVGSSSSIEVLNNEPMTRSIRGNNTKSIGEILGSSIDLSFWVTPEDGSAYDDLFVATQKQFLIEIYRDSILYFIGYMLPDLLEKTLIGNRYSVTITASDGLAELKDYKYLDSSGDNYSDRANLLTHIKRALDKTGLSIDITVKLGTYHNTSSLMTSVQCALDKAEVDSQRFYSIQDGLYKPFDCADVVGQVIGIMNCSIKQVNGKWYIFNNVEINSYLFTFDWATLTQQSRVSHNPSLAFDAYNMRTKGTQSKRFPLSKFEITFQNRYIPSNLVVNGDFSSGVSNWSNGSSPNNWYSFSELTETLKVTQITSMTSDKYVIADAFSLVEVDSSNQIILSVRATIDSITFTTPDPLGAGYPYLVAKLENLTTSEIKYLNLGQMSEGWKVHSPTSIPNTFGTANYRLTLIVSGDPNITNLIVRFDDVSLYVDYGDAAVTVDRLITVSNDDAVDEHIEEYMTRIGDSAETNDQGKITIGGTLTTDWRTYGNTEDKPAIELLGAYQLNQRHGFVNFVTVEIKDPSDTIHPETILSFDGIYYRMIRFNKSYKNITVEADLLELTT